MAAHRPLSPAVLAVLERSAIDGQVLRLPPDQLDRKLYVEVDKVLVAMGGKWDRRTKGHLFAGDVDVAAELDAVLQGGTVTDWKQSLGFFETPRPIAERLVEAAGIKPGMRVLEPSAGRGGILAALPLGLDAIEVVEIDTRHTAALAAAIDRFGPKTSTTRANMDFLKFSGLPEGYDAIAMNPPFSGQADIDHVVRAHGMLVPGGRLAAVMSGGTAWRSNKKAKEFRDLVAAHGGSIVPLPEGSFVPSGTEVNTVLVTILGARGRPRLADLIEGVGR